MGGHVPEDRAVPLSPPKTPPCIRIMVAWAVHPIKRARMGRGTSSKLRGPLVASSHPSSSRAEAYRQCAEASPFRAGGLGRSPNPRWRRTVSMTRDTISLSRQAGVGARYAGDRRTPSPPMRSLQRLAIHLTETDVFDRVHGHAVSLARGSRCQASFIRGAAVETSDAAPD